MESYMTGDLVRVLTQSDPLEFDTVADPIRDYIQMLADCNCGREVENPPLPTARYEPRTLRTQNQGADR
jgi:hypothetical protein